MAQELEVNFVQLHNRADIAALFCNKNAVYEVLTMMGKDCRLIG